MQFLSADWSPLLPQEVAKILGVLAARGHLAYVVGGAVRDLLWGGKPKDFDLVTDAKPEQLAEIFPKTLDVGKIFGITVVVENGIPVEVATFRRDGQYLDSRRPTEIAYSGPEEDARRRDFTINGLFWDPAGKRVIDYVGGLADLHSHQLRTIGDPLERFREDALRMLRALRFLAQFPQLECADDVRAAILKERESLRKVSRERITQEFQKLLASPGAENALRLVGELDLWPRLFRAHVEPTELTGRYSRWRKARADFDPQENWEHWLPLGNLYEEAILSREEKLSLKNALALSAGLPPKKLPLAPYKRILGNAVFPAALALWCAGDAPTAAARLEEARRLWADREAFLSSGKLYPPGWITGKDLLTAGFSAGPEFKRILEKAEDAALNEEISSREDALAWLARFKSARSS